MTRLRDALGDLAEQAPRVDLAEAAIAGHLRRRRTGRVVAALATATALAVTGAAVTLPWTSTAISVAAQGTEKAPDLPATAVGPLGYAYQTPCVVKPKLDCSTSHWRVVTRSGKTYRLPDAPAHSSTGFTMPVSISRDGRMLAYYDPREGAHVVHDLERGTRTVSRLRLSEDRVGIGSLLFVSDDGRHLAFDPREGSKEPGMVIDVRTGAKVEVPGTFEPVSLKDGVVSLVRYLKTDLWLMPVTGGGKPVRFDGTFIMFSELSPDGRTVAAVRHQRHLAEELTLLDAKNGGTLRTVAIRGLPEDRGAVTATGPWRGSGEIAITYSGTTGLRTFAVDVSSGRARPLERFPGNRPGLTLPGRVEVK
ncbi:hypothetical protein [Nonomuraea endophytica]|uniref:WD40 repeat domain-containing protein n=1 Tax=Nonomuraea endophytica TaxID=714136 RepID=A0A7W8EHY5_9ACTN|nr:hypothetical protein [Nonomuraea endophytica]MBB5079077.1 hypothetical protein [Nonomuraea endophytica]